MDKVKTAKKADMDAKKEIIRAEDMDRGIFIPTGNLPKQETQKIEISSCSVCKQVYDL